MGRCKEIIIKVIPSAVANPFVKKHHYSGSFVQNSKLHFGAFLDGRLHGVLSYGSSMDKNKTIKLVEGTGWNEFLELNRMAFDDELPRNAESYCIGKTLRMIKKQAPQIKWVISFADATQCGDGTIYRASNFILTGIKKNTSILLFPNGMKATRLSLDVSPLLYTKIILANGWENKKYTHKELRELGVRPMTGYQIRYIYFIDKSYRKRLTVPELPFSEIDKIGAGMYKGECVTREARHNECEAQVSKKNKQNGNETQNT